MKLHHIKKRTAEPQNIPPQADQISKGGIASRMHFVKINS